MLLNFVGKREGRDPKNNLRDSEENCSSDDGDSSLEESVEDHKQPQTEEIMNAEIKARVRLFSILDSEFTYSFFNFYSRKQPRKQLLCSC